MLRWQWQWQWYDFPRRLFFNTLATVTLESLKLEA
jgi:hypothetical protein